MNRDFLLEFIKTLQQHEDKDDVIHDIIRFLRSQTNAFSIGIRLQEGDDFPYYSTLGFSDKFLKVENFLCCKDQNGEYIRDKCNNVQLECMCGTLLNKCLPEEKKCLQCYTKNGGFWTNSVKSLIEETNGQVGVAKIRGTCIETGYKSMAIIPIPYKNKNIGLIQLNDFEENKFNQDMIDNVEELAAMIGCVIGHLDMQKTLQLEKEKLLKQNLKLIIKELRNSAETILKKNGVNGGDMPQKVV
jgi:hypothetical protein